MLSLPLVQNEVYALKIQPSIFAQSKAHRGQDRQGIAEIADVDFYHALPSFAKQLIFDLATFGTQLPVIRLLSLVA